MKTPLPSRSARAAFTLIELITVIAIISILMGLLFTVLGPSRTAADRAKARTAVKTIVNACNSYATDYGKYPPIAAALAHAGKGGGGPEDAGAGSHYSYGDVDTARCKVPNNHLFDVLRAIDRGPNADHKLNKRRQSYFEDQKATDLKLPRAGFADGDEFAQEMQGQLLDPWGKQYCIILDADGDGFLKLDAFFQDLAAPVRSPAAAFSMAKNLQIGGKGYPGRLRKERSNEAPEDIVSWE